MAPLVSFVQQTRGLTFKHPVAVDFLTTAQYAASLHSGGASSTPGQGTPAQTAGLYRAVGLVSGNVDLAASDNTLVDDGTLAYYSHVTKRIAVRGTDIGIATQVTLVHELTHALQDQYFDLSRIDRMTLSGQQTAFETLFEGDAVRVQDAYAASLSADDQATYQRQEASQQASAGASLNSVPPALVTLFGAPYALGPELLKVLLARGGNAAVDKAFKTPPVDEQQVFDPWDYLAGQQPLAVHPPALPQGAKRFDGGDFGALSWYVVLTQRIAPALALPAADAWAGDAYVAYTQNQRSCLRASVTASSATGATALTMAFTAWAQAMPEGSATVVPTVDGVDVASCDPGTSADLGAVATAQDALVLPVARTEFALGAIGQGAATPQARCAGTKVSEGYSEAELEDPTGAAFSGTSGQQRLIQTITGCQGATT